MMSEGRNSQFIGVAGVHYVASCLAHLGLHAVPTTRNVAGPDVLISTVDGASSLSLQVKTAVWALRTRGRGENKKPHHYEWEIGWRSAKMNLHKLLFALVDLKEFEEMPDVFVVPAAIIYDYFDGGDPETWPRARYHPEIAEVDKYKNNWELLKAELARKF